MLSLRLGDITFTDFEVPERLSGLGGEQGLVVHQLPGGRRVIDAMGRIDAEIQWSGIFRGNAAINRAEALDKMRVAGAVLTLSFGPISRQVVISRFTYDVERIYEVPYQVSLVVVTSDAVSNAAPNIEQMVKVDTNVALDLSKKINDVKLNTKMGALSDAVSKVTNFANMTKATIAGVVDKVQAVQSQVKSLISSAENTLMSVTTLGGILPNNPVSTAVAKMSSQVNAMVDCANLYELNSVVGRIGDNLAAYGAGGAQVVMAGGDLYRLAADHLGSALEWPTIAAANNLTDPIVSGIKTILVPPYPKGADGLLDT